MTTQLVLGPPEVLWLDSPELEHWTGRSARTITREFYPAGLAIYERGARRYILHSEFLAFLKTTSRRKEFTTNDGTGSEPDTAARFTRDDRGRLRAVAGAGR